MFSLVGRHSLEMALEQGFEALLATQAMPLLVPCFHHRREGNWSSGPQSVSGHLLCLHGCAQLGGQCRLPHSLYFPWLRAQLPQVLQQPREPGAQGHNSSSSLLSLSLTHTKPGLGPRQTTEQQTSAPAQGPTASLPPVDVA